MAGAGPGRHGRRMPATTRPMMTADALKLLALGVATATRALATLADELDQCEPYRIDALALARLRSLGRVARDTLASAGDVLLAVGGAAEMPSDLAGPAPLAQRRGWAALAIAAAVRAGLQDPDLGQLLQLLDDQLEIDEAEAAAATR